MLGLAAVAGLVVGPATAASFPDNASAESAARGASYLAGRQGEDGSVPEGASAHTTAETMIALAAGGEDDAVDAAVENLEQTAVAGASSGPYTGKIVSALVLAGEDPRDFAETDFVTRLNGYYNPATGSYGGNIYGDALAMAGVLAAGEGLPPVAEARLRNTQCPNGGWSYQGVCAGQSRPDTDTTAMALSILSDVAGRTDTDVLEGREWLVANQDGDGCWAYDPAGPQGHAESANSCGLALSAIVALEEDPNAGLWADGDATPTARLRDFQQSGGEFHAYVSQPGSVEMATIQAVPGMAGWKYPVSPPTLPEEEPGPPGGGGNAPGNGGNDGNGGNAGGDGSGSGSGGGASSKAPASTGATSSTGAGDPGSRPGDRDRRHDRGDPTSTSSTVVPRVLGREINALAWPVLGAGGDGAGAYDQERGRPPDLVPRETGDEGPGVARAGLVATGALGSVGFGAGAVWRRHRMAGLL